MIQAPLQLLAITTADALEKAIGLFLDTVLEPVGGQDRDQGEREDEGADESEGHGVGHGMEKSSGGTSQSIDGEITGDDDGDGVKNGAVDIASGGEDDVVDFVFLAMTQAELAVNVFDHNDGAVNDDAEVDSADGEQVGSFAGGMEKDEGEEKSERNGECGYDSSTDADEEKDEDNENEHH